jgi:hypothetical protein
MKTPISTADDFPTLGKSPQPPAGTSLADNEIA